MIVGEERVVRDRPGNLAAVGGRVHIEGEVDAFDHVAVPDAEGLVGRLEAELISAVRRPLVEVVEPGESRRAAARR